MIDRPALLNGKVDELDPANPSIISRRIDLESVMSSDSIERLDKTAGVFIPIKSALS